MACYDGYRKDWRLDTYGEVGAHHNHNHLRHLRVVEAVTCIFQTEEDNWREVHRPVFLHNHPLRMRDLEVPENTLMVAHNHHRHGEVESDWNWSLVLLRYHSANHLTLVGDRLLYHKDDNDPHVQHVEEVHSPVQRVEEVHSPVLHVDHLDEAEYLVKNAAQQTRKQKVQGRTSFRWRVPVVARSSSIIWFRWGWSVIDCGVIGIRQKFHRWLRILPLDGGGSSYRGGGPRPYRSSRGGLPWRYKPSHISHSSSSVYQVTTQ